MLITEQISRDSKGELKKGKYYCGVYRNSSHAVLNKKCDAFRYNRRYRRSVHPKKLLAFEDRIDTLDYFLESDLFNLKQKILL